MKFNLLCIFGLVCLIALCNARPADEEYAEYGEEPAPAPAPKPTRPNPLKNRRNPLAGRSNGKASTTTTAAPAKVEESEIDEEPLDENIGGEAAVPTTEVPKKFKAGSVRPFRSNDDLLAALKRRREQAATHKSAPKAVHQEEESGPVEATPAPSKNRVNNGRKRFNHNKAAASAEASNPEENAATPTPARAARRFPGRN